MKLVVHGESVGAAAARLRMAIGGLAARGHDVTWVGAGAPAFDGVRAVEHGRALRGARADLAAGAGPATGTALLAHRVAARGLLLGIGVGAVGRWSLLDRMAWDATPGFALLEEDEAARARDQLATMRLERVALWSATPVPGEVDATHPDVDVLERAGERLLARTHGGEARPAVFVDRDGTLIAEHGYLSDPERVELLPGVAGALRELSRSGIPVVVISDQAGVGRGRFPLAAVHATMARLRRLLRAEGVELDAVRFCPHAPDAGCACRKPGTRLLVEVAEDLRLSLRSSAMIGDKRLDAATGQAAGGTGLLVRTGYGREEERLTGDGTFERAPDGVFDDLAGAAAWVLDRLESR